MKYNKCKKCGAYHPYDAPHYDGTNINSEELAYHKKLISAHCYVDMHGRLISKVGGRLKPTDLPELGLKEIVDGIPLKKALGMMAAEIDKAASTKPAPVQRYASFRSGREY